MPESRKRRRTRYTSSTTAKQRKVTPQWLVVLMLSLLVLGLLWIVVTYVFQGQYPIPGIGNGNLFVGFGLLLVGLVLMSGWH